MAKKYATRPGTTPLKMTTSSQIRRKSVGSTLKYSPNPPQTPAKILFVLLRYNLFVSMFLIISKNMSLKNPQFTCIVSFIAGSSSGRMRLSGSRHLGSNPSPAALLHLRRTKDHQCLRPAYTKEKKSLNESEGPKILYVLLCIYSRVCR